MVRLILVIGAVSLLSGVALAQAEPAQIVEPAKDGLWPTVDASLFWAKAEMRYQSAAAEYYAAKDFWWKWAAVIFGLAAFAGPLMLRIWKAWFVETLWYFVGFIALCAALWSTFAGYDDLKNRHALLAERWLLLANDWKGVATDFKSTPYDELKRLVEKTSTAQIAAQTDEPVGILHEMWENAAIKEGEVEGRSFPPKQKQPKQVRSAPSPSRQAGL